MVPQTRQCVGPKQDNVWFPTVVPKHENREEGSDFDDFFDEIDRGTVENFFASAKKSQRANDETTTDEKVYRRPFCYKSFHGVQNLNAHLFLEAQDSRDAKRRKATRQHNMDSH